MAHYQQAAHQQAIGAVDASLAATCSRKKSIAT
jgi:hypothetical protein